MQIKKSHLVVLFIISILISLFVYFSILSQSAEQSSQTTVVEISEPSIGLETILTVDDVEQALLSAAQDSDFNLIQTWQSQILLVAKEAGYQEQDIDFLIGQQGAEYLMFRGVRLLFQRDVKQAYRRGESLEGLFRQYPQASDLFEQTEELFFQRDQILQSIAQTLFDADQAQDQAETEMVAPISMEQAQRAAMQIWRERNAVDTPNSD